VPYHVLVLYEVKMIHLCAWSCVVTKHYAVRQEQTTQTPSKTVTQHYVCRNHKPNYNFLSLQVSTKFYSDICRLNFVNARDYSDREIFSTAIPSGNTKINTYKITIYLLCANIKFCLLLLRKKHRFTVFEKTSIYFGRRVRRKLITWK